MSYKILENDVIENVHNSNLTLMLVKNSKTNMFEVLGTTATKEKQKAFYTVSRSFETESVAAHLYNGLKQKKQYALNTLKKEINKWKLEKKFCEN